MAETLEEMIVRRLIPATSSVVTWRGRDWNVLGVAASGKQFSDLGMSIPEGNGVYRLRCLFGHEEALAPESEVEIKLISPHYAVERTLSFLTSSGVDLTPATEVLKTGD
jgi:hypothetical protein